MTTCKIHDKVKFNIFFNIKKNHSKCEIFVIKMQHQFLYLNIVIIKQIYPSNFLAWILIFLSTLIEEYDRF